MGITREARPVRSPSRRLPEELRSDALATRVRARVLVAADGRASANLIDSSGDARVDRWVLESLARWKWEAAMRGGVTIDSTRTVVFVINVD